MFDTKMSYLSYIMIHITPRLQVIAEHSGSVGKDLRTQQSHYVVSLSKTRIKYWFSQVDRKSFQHDWKIVDWDVKHRHKQKKVIALC